MTTRRVGLLAFVLAGSGSLGAAQVGMLTALIDAGVRPDLVVGASVGAINGFSVAADPTSEGMVRLGEIWRGLSGRVVYPWSVLGAFLALLGYWRSLLDPTPLRHLLERHFPVRRLEDTTIPCYATATDALSGEEVSIARDPQPTLCSRAPRFPLLPASRVSGASSH